MSRTLARRIAAGEMNARRRRSALCITTILDISEERYLELWFDLGVEYSAYWEQNAKIEGLAKELQKNNQYWFWWMYRFMELNESFIQWKNPYKGMDDFMDMHTEGAMPPPRVREIIEKTIRLHNAAKHNNNVSFAPCGAEQ